MKFERKRIEKKDKEIKKFFPLKFKGFFGKRQSFGKETLKKKSGKRPPVFRQEVEGEKKNESAVN